MTCFFCDRRSDFAHAFPELCIKEVPARIVDGKVEFKTTTAQVAKDFNDLKWFQDREKKSCSDK